MERRIDAHVARTQLGQITDLAVKNNDRLVVDRRGEPSVVIMSVQDFIRTSAPPPGWLQNAWAGATSTRCPSMTSTPRSTYSAVLAPPKFSFPPEQIVALIAMLERAGEIFCPPETSVVSPDPSDRKFLLCAIAAQADFIVTGNKRYFPDSPYGITRVVSGGELLDWITLGQT